MEKKHNPIKGQKLIGKIENERNVVLIPPIQNNTLWVF